jgi:acetyl esterase/lipase
VLLKPPNLMSERMFVFSALTSQSERKLASPFFRCLAAIVFLCISSVAGSPLRVETNVVYGMCSGLALLLDVHYPHSPNGYGIVFIAGSGWSAPLSLDAKPLKESDQVKIWGEPLVKAGYTVFTVNHRALPRFSYPAPVEDAQRAVRFIRYHAAQYGIRPDQIGAVGGSSGGHLVSLLGLLDGQGNPNDGSPINRVSAKVQCVVTRAAPADLVLMAKEQQPLIPLFGYAINWDPSSFEHRTFVEASPVTYVSADDPPFLMVHGDADTRVFFKQSEVLEAALRKAGVQVKLLRVPSGGHGPKFDGANNPPDYIGEMIHWLDQHLIGRRIPKP